MQIEDKMNRKSSLTFLYEQTLNQKLTATIFFTKCPQLRDEFFVLLFLSWHVACSGSCCLQKRILNQFLFFSFFRIFTPRKIYACRSNKTPKKNVYKKLWAKKAGIRKIPWFFLCALFLCLHFQRKIKSIGKISYDEDKEKKKDTTHMTSTRRIFINKKRKSPSII